MYPVSLGFAEATSRINALLDNGHHAEALVTSVFTFEKLTRRTLRVAIIARGFTSKHALKMLDRTGFEDIKRLVEVFDKNHRSLAEIVGKRYWQFIPAAVTMRNKLAHGERTYKLSECKTFAEHVLRALNIMHQKVTVDYGYLLNPAE